MLASSRPIDIGMDPVHQPPSASEIPANPSAHQSLRSGILPAPRHVMASFACQIFVALFRMRARFGTEKRVKLARRQRFARCTIARCNAEAEALGQRHGRWRAALRCAGAGLSRVQRRGGLVSPHGQPRVLQEQRDRGARRHQRTGPRYRVTCAARPSTIVPANADADPASAPAAHRVNRHQLTLNRNPLPPVKTRYRS